MNTKAVLGVLIALAFIVFGATLYYSFSDRNVEEVPEREEESEVTGFVPDIIDARHQFRDGTHIVVGEIAMPTPCDLLDAEAVVAVREPQNDRATIQFTTVNESEMCAQVITQARFKVSFSAGEDAEIVGTWNGAPVRLNIVEVGPEEDLGAFEVFFKG